MELKLDRNKTYGLALEGGGAKGAYQIGAWKALREAGIHFSAVSGTSVGALNGAMIVMDDLEKAENVWNNIHFSQVMDVDDEEMRRLMNRDIPLSELKSTLRSVADIVRNRGFDVTPLRKWVAEVVDADKICHSDTDFFIVTYSLSDHQELELKASELDEDELCDMLLASAYLPAFRLEKLGGKYYADGGVQDVVPIHALVENGCKAVVMEVSSQGLMLDRVAGVDFDYGIFTNLSKDHIGPNEHASFEEYRDWKAKLFTLCKTGIFNVDDANAAYMMEHATCEKLTYGERTDADYRAKDIELYREKGVLGIQYALCGKLDAKIVVDLPGEFSVHNSLAAVAVADQMQVGITDIQNILKEAKARGRVEMIPISDSFTLMIDYAHNAMALESLLTALRAYNPKRLVTLFGCGGNRSRDRRFEMGEVSGKMSDFTIITSDNPRDEEPLAIIADIETGMKKTDGEYVKIADRKEAIRYAILHAKEGDVIVLAGKGHEDYQEIHGVKHHMDERDLIREILEEEDVTNICGYNNRYFA